MNKDPWKVLGIPHNASKADIKAAFKRVAMQCHPDKLATAPKHEQQHAEARFRAAKDAYEFLTDHRAIPRGASSSRHHHGHGAAAARQQHEYAEYMRYHAQARRRYAQTEAAAAWARRFASNFTRIDAAFHVAILGGSLLAFSLFSGIGDGLWARHNAGKSYEEALATVHAAKAARGEREGETKSGGGGKTSPKKGESTGQAEEKGEKAAGPAAEDIHAAGQP